MILTAVETSSALHSTAAWIAAAPHQSHFIHILFRYGLIGIFLVSIVDSSFVPLPIPGVTDIMLVLFAAQHANLLLLVLAATAGSALGGYLSYQVGHAGGMQFIEKRVPPRIFRRVTGWMENHAILAVALPAILPPPMPLSPFVLAAGALNMSKRKFMTAFTISRAVRHIIAVWLGVHYGKQVLRMWSHLSDKWATTFLVVIWSVILIGCAIAFWRIYKTSRSLKGDRRRPQPAAS
jgi:membrane protein YqaA with SNARE-associated domain